MTLIIIHGAAAVGKLTVANEIAARTGFKVFHNHLSIDCTKPVFEFGTDAFWRINGTIRIETIAEAVREGIDVIHTFCYVKGADDDYFYRLIAAAKDNGGTVQTVLLLCGDEERRRRIGNESRRNIGKLADPDSVTRSQGAPDLESPLPGRETLVIDNTDLTAGETAEQIIEFFRLGQQKAADRQ
jgi:hypothetical protein